MVRGDLHHDIGALTQALMVNMLSMVIAVAGLAFGAARLV
jgi:hypothetical protein